MAKGLRADSNTVTTRQLRAPATGPAPDSAGPTGNIPLASLTGADDLKAIEALTGTGSLHRTGTDTWALRQSLHTTDTPQFARLGLGVASVSGRQLYTVGEAAGAEEQWMQDQYSTDVFPASIRLRKARGTLASKSAVANNDFLGLLQARSWDGSDWATAGSIFVGQATENWSGTNQGSRMTFWTTITGGTSHAERMRINGEGNLLIGTTSNTGLTGSGGLKIASTTAGSTPTAAALIVGGGVGIGDDLRAVGNLLCGYGASTEGRFIDVGTGRTGDGASWIDLVGDTTYTDYGFRLLRSGGANGTTRLHHRGTGFLEFYANETCILRWGNGSAEVMRLNTVGNLLIGGTSNTGLGASAGNGGLRVFATTEATASAGAGIVDGGLLVKKRIFTNDAIQTGNPSGGTADLWKLGQPVASSPFSNDTKIRVDINGVAYDLLAVAV